MRYLLLFLLAFQAMAQPFRSFPAWDSQPPPLLEDTFSTPLPAGSVHLTPADGRTPSMIRTVVDTESKLSISGGKLVFAGGKASPQVGDPGLFYASQTRTAGKAFIGDVNLTSGTGIYFGWAADRSLTYDDLIVYSASTLSFTIKNNNVALAVYPISAPFTASYGEVLRDYGSFPFVKVSGVWKLLYPLNRINTTPVYPSLFGNASIALIDNIRIPRTLYIPTPVASDSFNRASLGSTDGLGHQEANGGAGLAWQTGANNTWSILAGKLVNSPTMGNELIQNGDFASATGWNTSSVWTIDTANGWSVASGITGYLYQNVMPVGFWYVESFNILTRSAGSFGSHSSFIPSFGTSSTGVKSFRGRSSGTTACAVLANGATGTVDDVSAKQLPTPDLFCTVNAGTADVLLDVAINGTSLGSSGTQAGVVLNLDNPTDPKNFVIIYFDGAGNIRAEKCINGNYTSAFSTPVTYGAGKVLRVMHDGSPTVGEYRVFYDNVLINSAPILSFTDDAYKNNTYHGTFSTSSNASFSGLTIWPRGNEGQYQALDYLK